MGNDVLSELLTEDLARFPNSDEPTARQPLLALGEMTDWSLLSKPVTTRVLAVAMGASGELLRLAHVEDSQWIWGEDRESVLHLSVIDSLDNFEEVIWASDGLPISQIKFVTGTPASSNPVRWLLVQKQTSTSILQPGYEKDFRARDQKGQAGTPQGLSRVNPNLLVTLGHQETGGSAHVDAAVYVPNDGRPPQLCVIDECGYWTLWNVLGKTGFGKSSIRLSLHKCGHTLEGPLREIPRLPMHASQHHGVLFVEGGQADSDAVNGLEETNEPQQQSRYLLTWSSKHIGILDLETDTSLPILDFVTSMSKREWILDVQPSPVSHGHVFVLTNKSLIWVDVFPSGTTSEQGPQPAAILICPHLSTDSNDLKFTVCRASNHHSTTSMAIIYSSKRAHTSVFWFRFRSHSLPDWHRQQLSLPRNRESDSRVQLLTFQPVPVYNSSRARGLGVEYQQENGQFFQGMLLSDDLGLKYCMAFSSQSPYLVPSLPTTRLAWTHPDRHKQWRKKRQRILRQVGEYFVIPDAMGQIDKQLIRRPPRDDDDKEEDEMEAAEDILGTSHQTAVPRPTSLDISQFSRTVLDSLLTGNQGIVGISVPVIDAIQGLIQHGHLTGSLPLRTWLDAVEEVANDQMADGSYPTEDSSQQALETLFGTADGQTVLAQFDPELPADPRASFNELQERFEDVWLQPLRDRMSEQYVESRYQWISELATEVALETYGVAVQESPLFNPLIPPSAQLSQAIPSSYPFPPLSQISSSQVYNSSIPPSSQTQPSGPSAGEAFERLQLLAPSIRPKKIGATKPAQLLSLWPTERGLSTEDYVSSVAIATEKKFDPAKQRLQKIEAKRRAMVDKYRLPSSMRRGMSSQAEPQSSQQDSLAIPMRPGPPTIPGIMTSQQAPSSSQSQGPLTMSQPIPGAFGERKKTTKKSVKKKKSGFR